MLISRGFVWKNRFFYVILHPNVWDVCQPWGSHAIILIYIVSGMSSTKKNNKDILLMLLKSCRFIFSILAVVSMLWACGNGRTGLSESNADTLELNEFKKYVYETRMKLLYEHTYDTANIPVADSIYRKAEMLNSDWCKLRALELKYYVYVADPAKEKEFLEAIDEYLEIAASSPEYQQELYDGTYAKVEYLIDLKRYISAQEIVRDLMKKAETSKFSEGLYLCNYLMGCIYQHRGDHSMAIPYLKKAEEYGKTDSMHVSLVSRELSMCYQAIKKYDEALSFARRCWSYANNKVYKIFGEYTYLTALYESGNEAEFVKAYEASAIRMGDVDAVLPEHMQLGLQARLAVCRKEWDKAEAIASRIDNDEERLNELFTVNLRKGDYKKAFEVKLRIAEMNDSMRSVMQTNDLNEMEVRLGNSRLKIEADELKLTNQRIMNVSVIVALVFVMIIVALGAVFFVRNRASRYKRKAIEERELFYRNVTHQLRTPMTVVLGMVEQLKQHIPEDDVVGRESLEAAHRQSDHLLELIKKLIAASKEGEMVELSDTASPSALPRREGTLSPRDEGKVSKVFSNDGYERENVISSSPLGERMPTGLERGSILVAEDNDDVAMLVCNMLRDKGYEVSRAVDGQEALEMLREELPDMLITDIAMPRMDGLELMRNVRDDDTMCCLPIVVVSARVEDHERLEGISAGAEVYLAKPFINEELLLIVEKLLEQRRRLRRMFTNSRSDDETSRQIPEVDVEFFKDINKLIDDNLISGDVSTSFLADRLRTSISTLNRRLKNMSGLTATVYIRNRRILMAKRLLETTDQPVSEIEVQCGFNTSGHFSRVFKAETGLSPVDYRLNLKAKGKS